LTLNYSADIVVRNGLAEQVSTAEAMDILEMCKQAGLAQTGDNVQRKVSYICNCCSCCCGMFEAIKEFNLRGAVVTSNWIMRIDGEKCSGCGRCVAACPINGIRLVDKPNRDRPTKTAACDDGLCLGCGVCYSACRQGALRMESRAQRVYTPETVFDRVVTMAIERGKLGELIGDTPQLSHRALGRIVAILEKTPLVKAAMSIKPLRSAFLESVVRQAKHDLGDVGELFV
jgi:ferredoxin